MRDTLPLFDRLTIQSFKSCRVTCAGFDFLTVSRNARVTFSQDEMVSGSSGVPSFLNVVFLSWINAVRRSSSDFGAAGDGLVWVG